MRRHAGDSQSGDAAVSSRVNWLEKTGKSQPLTRCSVAGVSASQACDDGYSRMEASAAV